MKFGKKLQLKFYFNPIFYTKLTNALYKNDRWGGGITFGTQYHFLPKLTSYAELGYSYKPASSGNKGIFGYDVGFSYLLFKHFVPLLELDNITIHDRNGVKVGFKVPVNASLGFAADYIESLHSNANGFELKLNYKI